MTQWRIQNEYATADLNLVQVPWGMLLEIRDAKTGITVQLDALEVEALTGLTMEEREALVYRSGGALSRPLQQNNLQARSERNIL